MSCGCGARYEESDEVCESWSEGAVQRARTEHQCCECLTEIPAGSRYCWARGLIDGTGWHTWKRCTACAALAELMALTYGTCPLWGNLFDYCDQAGFDVRKWRDKVNELKMKEADGA